jgi:TrmH family RNA methyltransferase
VIHNVQLPQNVGALIRTAEGAGVSDIYMTGSSADAWGPKALRGSSGSAFRVPIRKVAALAEALSELKTQGVRSVAATQNGKTAYDKVDWKQPSAVVMGSEGSGFSVEELALFDETLRIPMKGRVESLNVGSAAAVCLFEAARQRQYES